MGVALGAALQVFLAGRQRKWAIEDERVRWERDKLLDLYASLCAYTDTLAIYASRAAGARGVTGNEFDEELLSAFAKLTDVAARVELLAPQVVIERTRELVAAAMNLREGLADGEKLAEAARTFGTAVGNWTATARRQLHGNGVPPPSPQRSA